MTDAITPALTRRKDYQPYSHCVDQTDLTFELGTEERKTRVTSRLAVRPNPDPAARNDDRLVLDGDKSLVLESVKVNGTLLRRDKGEYEIAEEKLIIPHMSHPATVEIVTDIDPHKNTEYKGLYISDGNFVTDCEAEGFRHITYFPDRPDVMSSYTTKIVADHGRLQHLLSNGNKMNEGRQADGRDFVSWSDPKPKASYLFALVAGDFDVIEGKHTAPSGHVTMLRFYTPKGQGETARFSMDALDKAMAWDEKFSGHECALDDYKVVAASKFNAGAMENRGLNIFFSRAVLANPQIAQDANYKNIFSTTAHEYCHDLTGNDITQKMWTDIALKEGFTAYREQECVHHWNPTPVNRIDEVKILRAYQFPLDAKPTAHPVLREEYLEPDNCYDKTTYSKGAELIRIIHTIIGAKAFREGMELYRTKYDGKAIWTEDLIHTFEEASGKDLSQFFETWYKQPGTPEVKARGVYDPKAKTYTLILRQNCASAPGQRLKKPYHIPVRLGLIDSMTGQDMPLVLQGEGPLEGDTIQLREHERKFVFTGVEHKPVPSLLRNFSAPVKLDYKYTNEELIFLMQHDKDGFNAYEAGQRIAIATLTEMLEKERQGRAPDNSATLISAMRTVLRNPLMDRELKARMLTLPDEDYLAGLAKKPMDPLALHHTRERLIHIIGTELKGDLKQVYEENKSGPVYVYSPQEVGRRSLRSVTRTYLAAVDPQSVLPEAMEEIKKADNLTDKASAYQAVMHYGDSAMKSNAVESFRAHVEKYPPTAVPWIIGQGMGAESVQDFQKSMDAPLFDAKTPMHMRALLATLIGNAEVFHRRDGSGYAFLADQVIRFDSDKEVKNPEIAAQFVEPLTRFSSLCEPNRTEMLRQLRRVEQAATSPNVLEFATKTLSHENKLGDDPFAQIG